MKFALFDFDHDKSVEIGESAWILDLDDGICNNADFDFNESVQVMWPSCGKKSATLCNAKVLRFEDDKKFLVEMRKAITDGMTAQEFLSLKNVANAKATRKERCKKSIELESETLPEDNILESNPIQLHKRSQSNIAESQRKSAVNILNEYKRKRRNGSVCEDDDSRQSANKVMILEREQESLKRELERMRADQDLLVEERDSLTQASNVIQEENNSLRRQLNALQELPDVVVQLKLICRSLRFRSEAASNPSPAASRMSTVFPSNGFTDTSSSGSVTLRDATNSNIASDMGHRNVFRDFNTSENSEPSTPRNFDKETRTSTPVIPRVIPQRPLHNDTVHGGELVTKPMIDNASKRDARKMTNDLMLAVFTPEVLRSHSLTGVVRDGQVVKPALDAESVRAIIVAVQSHKDFKHEREANIRRYISEKLNNFGKKKITPPTISASAANDLDNDQ